MLGQTERLFNAISMGSGVSPQKPLLEDDPQLQKALAAQIMLGLKDKLSPKERWAIVFYLRALQQYVGEATSSRKGRQRLMSAEKKNKS